MMSNMPIEKANMPTEYQIGRVQGVGPLQVEEQFQLAFSQANQVFVFQVTTDGTGDLLVDTLDCCIPGDQWGVRIIDTARNCIIDEACGNGSIEEFSGEAVAPNFTAGVVEVFYCQGVDIFPAGMTVRFRYTGDSLAVSETEGCISEQRTCSPGLVACELISCTDIFDELLCVTFDVVFTVDADAVVTDVECMGPCID